MQEAGLPICPGPLAPWFPGAVNPPNIRDCYNGEDCWMGPYGGAAAHCGLDINMPKVATVSARTAGADKAANLHIGRAGVRRVTNHHSSEFPGFGLSCVSKA